MFLRTLAALCCLVSPAAAEIIVDDGDYFATMRAFEPVRVIGGRIDRLTLLSAEFSLEGGSVGVIDDYGDSPIFIRGGDLAWRPGIVGSIAFWERQPQATFEGYSFDVTPGASANVWKLTSVLLDFTTISVNLVTDADYCRSTPEGAVCLQPRITLVTHDRPTPPGDTNGDSVVDLADLNTIRNNFGAAGEGDLDGSGVVDLPDLNEVRNNFGAVYPAVPEPATWALLLAGATTMLVTLPGRGKQPRSCSGN